ncbi:hypothetical protein EIP91_001727 [Steccherinum ochraceum]|uniref:Cytochrome c oxidase assembly factor 6 n=1 Tax=Steccherinum ochraceum TaxID=92696 RepID=A0A4R0RQM2_9APHY|nr:hypothetical protein EIP91_001727 [Steccherinum ochraceum]
MGWLGSSDKKGPDPVSRQDRQKCWESRDAYFACLDAAGVVNPGTEGTSCAAPLKAYQQNCAKSWVDYFNQRRVLAEQQKSVLATVNTQASAANRK